MAKDSELITVRVPTELLEPLRLACQATGRTMSSEIRLGIQTRVHDLQDDPEVKRLVNERIARLQALYGGVSDDHSAGDGNLTSSKTGAAVTH